MDNSSIPENNSMAKQLHKKRGKAPPSKKWAEGVYRPRYNTAGSPVKNPKIAEQANEQHKKWLAAKIARVEAKMKKMEKASE